MQLFLADCQFPDIENQVKAYQLFVEAWENGEIAKSDKTDKFEMLFRVHAPGAVSYTHLTLPTRSTV